MQNCGLYGAVVKGRTNLSLNFLTMVIASTSNRQKESWYESWYAKNKYLFTADPHMMTAYALKSDMIRK